MTFEALKQFIDFLGSMVGYGADFMSWAGGMISSFAGAGSELWKIISGVLTSIIGLLG